jgi:hypothetical protein
MNFLDLCGPPGSGKSTLADAFWSPHALQIDESLPPASWQPFIDEITRLFGVIKDHPTLEAAIRMNNRSIRKVATVSRTPGTWVYIQTCLAQRGLGFGWRMVDMGIPLDRLRPYFELMPVSLGVVFTKCALEIVEQRNFDREKVAATAHENRAYMGPLMMPAIELAKEVLNERRVPVIEISTEQPIEDGRRQLVAFAMQNLGGAEALRSCGEMATISAVPSWWRS